MKADKPKPVANVQGSWRRDLWLCALLFGLTFLVFRPTLQNDFVDFDDQVFVTQNPAVQAGLTPTSVQWAFTSMRGSNWYPLTWLSHMLDCQLFGLKPAGHHFTSLFLHATNVVLLFLFLRRLTGARWPAFFIAAFFGLHPLRVESVAWVAERKDVLSTFFCLLSLWAYVKHVSRDASRATGRTGTGASPATRHPTRWYWASICFFAASLLSKQMAVTLPFVLLLLDFWPLARVQGPPFKFQNWKKLVGEKIPFFALAIAGGAMTWIAQRNGNNVVSFNHLPLDLRLENAVVSYARYLGKLFWPVDLVPFYLPPNHWPVGTVVLAGALLAGITAAVLLPWRRHPFGVTGWFWFIGMLVPVIGLVQIGGQAMADRYTYLPSIGFSLALTWTLLTVAAKVRHGQRLLAAIALAALAACVPVTRQQIRYWKNSETLFGHTVAVEKDNWFAHGYLALALKRSGRLDEAEMHYREALRLNPGDEDACNNFGVLLLSENRLDEATALFEQAIRLKPGDAKPHNNLGTILYRQGDLDRAAAEFQAALQLRPDDARTRSNLVTVLDEQHARTSGAR